MPTATTTAPSAGSRWSLLWLSYLVGWLVIRLVLRQPALFFERLKRRLLGVIELESLEGKVFYSTDVARPVEVALDSLQGEEVVGVHDQNEAVGPTVVERATSLTFYRLKEQTPSVLALTRFTVCDELTNEVVKVCEDVYYDTPDELCRIESEVLTAVFAGIDVDVSSWYELGTFPDISELIESPD